MLLHEFYSDEDCSRGDGSYRKASIFKEPDGSFTLVKMQDAAIIEELNLAGHSETYIENIAEDWVMGIDR
jgi:hypothetical protein